MVSFMSSTYFIPLSPLYISWSYTLVIVTIEQVEINTSSLGAYCVLEN